MNCFCQNCKNPVSEKREPCSKCGSKKRDIKITLTESISLHDQVGGKIKGKDNKKPRLEFKKGDDFHKKTATWNILDRVIDRANNWYKEIIKNRKGETIRNVEEPLNKHTGHGSAKYKNE